MTKKEHTDIELRSEEVQDILGQVPSWIIRWGTIIVFITVLLLITGSWIYRYPDIRRAEITVTTQNPPATLVTRTTGKIQKLFVSDNQKVSSGQHLCLIENAADYNSIIELNKRVNELAGLLPDFSDIVLPELTDKYILGEVQPSYARFVNLYQDYQNFLALEYHMQKINAYKLEIKKHESYLERLKGQRNILFREMDLVRRQYTRDSLLYLQGVIPKADLEKSEAVLLQKAFDYEQSAVNMSSTEIEITRLQQQILDLELTEVEEEQQQELSLMESFENLTAELAQWEQKYLLKAPIGGVVTFTKIWSENQNVREGDKVMTVIPDEQGSIIGKISLPVEGSGKVRPGQRVNIKFANYPHMEYGMVKGIISSISLVPNDENYAVEVELPDGLVTYYNIEIPFNQEMSGEAEILTDDRRLIERIVNPIKSLISEQQRARS
jgi:HlyD family secretion protein